PTACNGALPNGLSSVVAMNTTGAFLSGTSNVLYAGDLQGNLWRVDISSPNPALWTVSVLFQARDPSGTPQPITVTPAVTLNPLIPTLTGTMVYFATGQLLGIPDLSTTQVQSVYGIFDSGAAPPAPLQRADLQVQTMSSVNVTTTAMVNTSIRLLTSNAVNLPVQHGWYVDLNLASGERVVTDPALVNGTLQLTSYQPNASTCTGGGNGWYMVFDYATGGATDAAQFGWNSSDSISSADLYMGQTVSGVSEGAVYAAGPKMVTGAGGAVVYTTSGGAEITTGPDAGECTSIAGTTTSCIPKWQNLDSVSHGAWQEIR
ncbi:MAG: PilC/PilY family type IV pilus protein, partial [Steroidobacteraceae bacterium]